MSSMAHRIADSAPAFNLAAVGLKTGAFTLGHFLNDSYPNLYPALLPVLMVQLHFSVALAGLLSSIAALTTQLLQPIAGLMADRFGTRWFVVGGLATGAVVSSTALAFAPSYWVFVAALLIGGLGNACFHPHASALVGDISQARKGLSMSFFMIGGNLGRAFAPIAATTAFLWLGRHGLWVMALPGVAMALWLGRALTPPPVPRIRSLTVLTPEFRQGLRHATNLMAVVGLRNLASMSVMILVPILWHTLHRPLAEAAGLLSVLFLAGSLGNMSGGALSDRVGAKPVLLGSAVLSCVFLVLFVPSRGPWTWVLMALLGYALYSSSSVVMVAGQSLFPHNKGMASGLTLGVGNTIGALGVGLVGLVADHWGPMIALMVAAATLLVSLPFAWTLRVAPAAPATAGK
jgi:FSR family fosmidomycin resistance protein-like MFS transporter